MNANTTTLLIKKTQMKRERERDYFPSTRLAALKHNVNAL